MLKNQCTHVLCVTGAFVRFRKRFRANICKYFASVTVFVALICSTLILRYIFVKWPQINANNLVNILLLIRRSDLKIYFVIRCNFGALNVRLFLQILHFCDIKTTIHHLKR